MSSKIVLIVCVVIAVVAAVPAQTGGGAGPWAVAGGWGGAGGGAGGWGPAGGWGAGWGNGGANPWIPPWVASAPWYPQWVPCTTVGSSCQDCTTRLVCTKVGGLQRACTDPALPYCNLGECSATPSAECAPADDASADAAASSPSETAV
ncbi:uncharacterized protein LOC111353903 [Spodoptera litura]|uniref:Uncharacterized protein LOC111353903 n=1 Tax=Spodoptera litura TaxID=69820 RepID=A0A9J7E844_SPOLT|nr:uncharacterized protein LOC111353903 [Spodoptera litura]